MSKGTEGGAQQSIELLQKRYESLRDKKVQAQTNLDHATRSLEELKKEAREKYDTDDLDALREKLAVMTQQNEEKRSKYQADLDRIETELADVERTYAGPATPTSDETNRS